VSDTSFPSLRVIENDDKTFTRRIEQRHVSDLPAYDALVRVQYSSLNYKDALSATGNKGVTRSYPHTPGIDAAGEIVTCESDLMRPGDKVIVTGYDLGMNTPGGYGEYIRVPLGWIVPLPDGLTLHDSMALGTAGLTAALCVNQLRFHNILPDSGEVLVTGATGGVGSLAIAILTKLGYSVAAVTGKADAHNWLRQIGALRILTRAEATETARPLLKEQWAGVVDTVGGDILATAIKSTKRHGCVTCCGLVQSPNLNTTVYPFILRGVILAGVDSVEASAVLRVEMWEMLSDAWKPAPAALRLIARDVALDALEPEIQSILQGGVRGRVVVRVGGAAAQPSS
jgi:acrylyl-CoA reductase (NADPH)